MPAQDVREERGKTEERRKGIEEDNEWEVTAMEETRATTGDVKQVPSVDHYWQ